MAGGKAHTLPPAILRSLVLINIEGEKDGTQMARESAAAERRARSYGFDDAAEMRAYSRAHRTEIEAAREYIPKDTTEAGGWTFNPEQAVSYYYAYGMYLDENASSEETEVVTGAMRHDLIQYFMDYEDMDFDGAYDAMQEVYGDSGQED